MAVFLHVGIFLVKTMNCIFSYCGRHLPIGDDNGVDDAAAAADDDDDDQHRQHHEGRAEIT